MSPVLSHRQVQEIEGFATEKHRGQDLDHSMEHVELTVKIARYLAAREGADAEVCTVAAYLHDIAKNSSRQHSQVGAEMARKFLRGTGAPRAFIDRVCYAISQHDNDLPKESMEAQILWDADKLQSVGPLGFARVFGYRLVFHNRHVPSAVEMAREYASFFYNRFYTPTGQKIASVLQSVMKDFFRLYEATVNVELEKLRRE